MLNALYYMVNATHLMLHTQCYMLNAICLMLYSAGQKKRTAQKGHFWVRKYVLYIIFLFSWLKMLIWELKLLEVGDLLGSSMLRNFFSAARSIFSCKYFSSFIQYIWRFRNQFKSSWFCQTEFCKIMIILICFLTSRYTG